MHHILTQPAAQNSKAFLNTATDTDPKSSAVQANIADGAPTLKKSFNAVFSGTIQNREAEVALVEEPVPVEPMELAEGELEVAQPIADTLAGAKRRPAPNIGIPADPSPPLPLADAVRPELKALSAEAQPKEAVLERTDQSRLPVRLPEAELLLAPPAGGKLAPTLLGIHEQHPVTAASVQARTDQAIDLLTRNSAPDTTSQLAIAPSGERAKPKFEHPLTSRMGDLVSGRNATPPKGANTSGLPGSVSEVGNPNIVSDPPRSAMERPHAWLHSTSTALPNTMPSRRTSAIMDDNLAVATNAHPFQRKKQTNGTVDLTLQTAAIAIPSRSTAPKMNVLGAMLQQGTIQKPQDTRVLPTSVLDAEAHLAPRSDAVLTQTPTQVQLATSRMDLPQNVARQIADALQHMPNRPVEISLNPQELGRVRLAVSSSEAGIVVNVLAERQETMDLMRRHITSLESAIQDIGYSDIAFSFSGGAEAQDGTDDPSGKDSQFSSSVEADTSDETGTQIELTVGPAAGLDLRL